MFLPSSFFDSNQPVMLYGTTPPRQGASREDVHLAAEKLVARTQNLALDGLIVYDVQDESARTGEPRPFPFLPLLDSRVYSQILHQLSHLPIVTYKSATQMNEADWEEWLTQTASDFGITTLSLVGSPTRKQGGDSVSLTQATQMAQAHPARFVLGAVAIAERNSESRSESQRMIHKAQTGCEFFVSQSVYNSQKTITLLNNYARECREAGLAPKRVILTFAPCGRAKTLEFMKWLGVSIPGEIERGILEAGDPLSQSIEICRSILEEILGSLEDNSVPLGLNIESVSNKKEEIDASVELFQVLERQMKAS